MMKSELVNRVFAIAVFLAGGLGLLFLAGWGIWELALLVPSNPARVVALVALALLPVVAWIGWYFGHTEARGRLAGIDQAVDKVMGAATKTAGLRVGTVRAMRQATKPEPPVATVVLPDVEIIPRQLARGGQVINL